MPVLLSLFGPEARLDNHDSDEIDQEARKQLPSSINTNTQESTNDNPTPVTADGLKHGYEVQFAESPLPNDKIDNVSNNDNNDNNEGDKTSV